MSKQITVRVIDDMDGSEGAIPCRFALDGKEYEIDLSVENAARLVRTLAPFVKVARLKRVRPL